MGIFYGSGYGFLLIAMIITMIASSKLNSTYSRYARVMSSSGLTGREAAQRILNAAGIYNVRIEHIQGNLTDNYAPGQGVLHLSDTTDQSSSIAAIGVAAHECGHAMQYAENYMPLWFVNRLSPVARFGSMLAWPCILLGLFWRSNTSQLFLNIGIGLFSLAVLLSLALLPVEFDASRRALKVLSTNGMMNQEEIEGTRKVLTAAAMTYVASAAAAVLQLLRILSISGRRR